MENPTQTTTEKPNSIKERFIRKIENEPNLEFLKALFKRFPSLDMYLVGGIVRDTIISEDIKSKDYDFIAQGIPRDELEEALRELGHLDLVGRNFGVYKFRPYNFTLKEAFDIALPRTETAHGTGGRADFDTQSDHTMKVEDDLGRRDLTINAIAWDIKKQKLIDPYYGQKDLQRKIIRAVGNPFDRFTEDRSRMLRAIRFACLFDFNIDPLTYEAIESFMPHIAKTRINKQGKAEMITPMETIKTEIFKALSANPAKAFRLLEKTSAWREILPELNALRNNPKLWQRLKTTLELLTKENLNQELADEYKLDVSTHEKTGNFVFATILYYLKLSLPEPPAAKTKKAARRANPIEQIYNRLKLPKTEKDKIAWIIANIDTITTKLPDNLAGQEKLLTHKYIADALALALIINQTNDQVDDHLKYENQKDAINKFARLFDKNGKLPAPLLNGTEIMSALGITKGGPIVNKTMQRLRHEQLAGNITTKDQAINWIKKQ